MSGTLGVKIPAESRRGEGGESQVRAFFSDTFQWCVMSKDLDFGTDLWVMPVNAEGVPSFAVLGVQVKKGASYFRYPKKMSKAIWSVGGSDLMPIMKLRGLMGGLLILLF